MKFVLILFLLLYFHFCSSPQKFEDKHKNAISELIASYRGEVNKVLAILPLKDDPDDQSETDKQIHLLTQDEVFRSRKFKLVERDLLNRLLKEHTLAQQGLTDSEAIRLGKMSGADLVLIQSKNGKNISFRIVDVTTGNILAFSNLLMENISETALAKEEVLQARVITNEYQCKIKIFEGPETVPEPNKRKYSQSFPASTSRFIFADAVCGIISGKKKEKIEIAFRYLDEDGVLINQNKHDIEVKPEWGNFTYTSGWGYDDGGEWPLGKYKLAFLIEGKLMDEKEFYIK